MAEIVAQLIRSGFVESVHRGSVVVLDADGQITASIGGVRAAMFPRSANKPLQTVGMLRAGLHRDDPADLALISGSHSGEPGHIAQVRAMLRSGGLDEEALACPADYPIGEQAKLDWLRAGREPTRVAMNCSGKHAGMLLTCQAAGWPTANYQYAEHPLQKQFSVTVEELTSEAVAATGVDGCGALIFGFSLAGLARSFLRLVDAAPGSQERAVADAMRAHPGLVGGDGPERDDSRLMRGIPGLLAKGGAEGVMAVAVPGAGAVAVKIEDGAKRAVGPVTVAGLRRLGLAAPVLEEMAAQVVLGGGVPVGALRETTHASWS